MSLTKQELEYLSKFEINFKTAMEQGYTNPIPSVHKLKIAEIFGNHIGRKYYLNTSCPHCTLDLLKLAGKVYFSENKPKKGRPKKSE